MSIVSGCRVCSVGCRDGTAECVPGAPTVAPMMLDTNVILFVLRWGLRGTACSCRTGV
jgi:hypothetical protein